MYVLVPKFRFLEFRLLLSLVAPYYSSSPRTVWFRDREPEVRLRDRAGLTWQISQDFAEVDNYV